MATAVLVRDQEGSALSGKLPESIPLRVILLIALPALFPLLCGCLSAWSAGKVATGWVQYDMPYYMASARQHFDEGFRFTYSSPYANYGTPSIYFQPQIFLLGILTRTGLDPGILFNLFGLGALLFAACVAARLYEHIAGWGTPTRKLAFVCFFWGGGLLSLTGLTLGLLTHTNLAKAITILDPMDGYWMFNFGRNLIYPTEAYYHGVLLFAVLMTLKGRYNAALALAALLSMSHPYTGLNLSITLALFGLLGALITRTAASLRLFAGAVAITALHVSYYLVFLNRFADHRSVRAQWELDWPYLPWTFGPALCLVGFFTFVRFSRWRPLADAFQKPQTRLFALLFAVTFALTQHDLIVKPMQPIHFAHGYDWIALFFLGLPALMALIDQLRQIQRPVLRAIAVGIFIAVMLSDNLLWCTTFRDPSVQRYAIALTPDERDVLAWLNRQGKGPALVISEDGWVNYLTPTYTPLRVWSGHDYNTPDAVQHRKDVADLFQSRKPIPTNMQTYYIPRCERQWTPPVQARQVYANNSFVVWLAPH